MVSVVPGTSSVQRVATATTPSQYGESLHRQPRKRVHRLLPELLLCLQLRYLRRAEESYAGVRSSTTPRLDRQCPYHRLCTRRIMRRTDTCRSNSNISISRVPRSLVFLWVGTTLRQFILLLATTTLSIRNDNHSHIITIIMQCPQKSNGNANKSYVITKKTVLKIAGEYSDNRHLRWLRCWRSGGSLP